MMKLKKFLKRSFKDFALLILRLAAGGMMAFGHGIPKLIKYESRFHTFSDPIGLGSEISYVLTVFAEVFCAVAVAIGLYTRVTVLPLIAMLIIILLIVHADDPWGRKELAAVYLAMYTTIFIAGPGKYSVDNQIIR